MAQVFVPDDPRVRDQLQQGEIPAELREQPQRRVPRRRYGVIELFSYVEERGIFRLEAPETQEET